MMMDDNSILEADRAPAPAAAAAAADPSLNNCLDCLVTSFNEALDGSAAAVAPRGPPRRRGGSSSAGASRSHRGGAGASAARGRAAPRPGPSPRRAAADAEAFYGGRSADTDYDGSLETMETTTMATATMETASMETATTYDAPSARPRAAAPLLVVAATDGARRGAPPSPEVAATGGSGGRVPPPAEEVRLGPDADGRAGTAMNPYDELLRLAARNTRVMAQMRDEVDRLRAENAMLLNDLHMAGAGYRAAAVATAGKARTAAA